ncbi:MAG: hypothetical protein WC353_02440 [Candidatus Peribacter sp.]|jgi:hypothetical protein
MKSVPMFANSSIVRLQHHTYYHVGLVIAALKAVGQVTLHFPDGE